MNDCAIRCGRLFRAARILVLSVAWTIAGIAQAAPACPPQQPAHGPGSSDYAYASVSANEVRAGADGWWLFVPNGKTDKPLPVVVFCHGWGAMNPRVYRAWIDHIVRRGNIVVYPNYQDSLLTPTRTFLPNAVAAIRAALKKLSDPASPVHADTSRLAIVGHSAGGLLSAEIAATAANEGLPVFRAVMPVEPGDGSARTGRATIPNLSVAAMQAATLLLVVVGAEDHLAGEELGLRLYDEAAQLPKANRNVVELRSDYHGQPALIANHAAPSATFDPWAAQQYARRSQSSQRDLRNAGNVDALDWYGTWRLFDALCDAAFYNLHRAMALGSSDAQTAMGTWSDGVPVEPLRVLR